MSDESDDAAWQPGDTAPAHERILVFHPRWGRAAFPGIFHPTPYHGRGKQGWRVSLMPGDTWTWVSIAPLLWRHFPAIPREHRPL